MPPKRRTTGKSLDSLSNVSQRRPNLHPLLRTALIIAGYLSGFIILDLFSQQFQELRGIVAWYPPAGLTYTLLLVFGASFAPAVMVALFISSLFVYRMPQPLYLLLLWVVIISSIYGAAAWFLRQRIHFDWQLRRLRYVTWFVVTAVFVSALLAVLSVSSSALSSDMPRGEVLRAIIVWWIGETVGVLTVTPFLLIHVMPWLKQLAEGRPLGLLARASFPRLSLSVIGQAFSIVLVFYWVFGGSGLDEFRPVYLLTLPLIWIALDHGFKGVTTGIVVSNFGVTLAMWLFRFDPAHAGELQLLMIVNCIVGLLMGAVVTEHKQAEEETKISNEELSMLFELSHSLAEADNLEDILDIVNRHAVESIQVTFARIALVEDEKFIMRAAYPIRVLDHDLRIGYQLPIASSSHTQRVLEQNEPVILRANDPGISNEEKAVLLLDFAQSLCVIPLRSSDASPSPVNLLGLLMLGEARNEEREPFTPAKIRLAQSIGDSAAIAIRRVLLSAQTGRRLQQSMALSEIDLTIISTSDMAASLDVLLRHTTQQLGVDAADVWWFNPTSQELEFVAGCGFRTSAFENPKPIHLGEGNAGRAALERRIIHVANLTVRDDNARLTEALAVEPFVSYYAVPLIVKEQVKGVLELFHRTELDSNAEWLNFLHVLANQAAIAIDNSSLFNDLQNSNTELTGAYDRTIEGWSRAMDLRDKETEGHTLRVTEITMRLARAAGIGDADLVHVRRGALLHDMGKMGVPDNILLKPGKLTDEEWVIMRKHPQLAYDMLSPIAYLKPALDIPYNHHEKWDGTGYPRGLKGEQIPLAARLFAVIDVYDALTSDRPYRAAWTKERTLEHIRAGSGAHFDPNAVVLFVKMVSEDIEGVD